MTYIGYFFVYILLKPAQKILTKFAPPLWSVNFDCPMIRTGIYTPNPIVTGVRQEQDIYVRLIDSVTKQVDSYVYVYNIVHITTI